MDKCTRLFVIVIAFLALLAASLACGQPVQPASPVVVATLTPGGTASPTATLVVPADTPIVEENTETPSASAPADLAITGVTLSNAAPAVNEPVALRVTVVNQGGATAEGFQLIVIPHYGVGAPNPFAGVDLQPLAPGQSAVVPLEPGPAYLEAGTYTLRVLVTDDWAALGDPDSTGSAGDWWDAQITVGD